MVTVTTQPKITDIKSAQAEMTDFVKNPPSSPGAAVYKMADMLGVGATVQTAVTSIFPVAGALMPAISDLLSAFSSAPSIGEVMLSAVNALSVQISEGFKNLENALRIEIEAQADRTIDVVLSGASELAKEQSAALVFENYNVAAAADALREQKAKAYKVAMQDIYNLRKSALEKLQGQLQQVQQELENQYQNALQQVRAIIASIAPQILDALNSYLAQFEQQESRALPVESVLPGESAARGSNGMLLILLGGAALFLIGSKKR